MERINNLRLVIMKKVKMQIGGIVEGVELSGLSVNFDRISLNSRDLGVLIHDDNSRGNLICNETFLSAVSNGFGILFKSWN